MEVLRTFFEWDRAEARSAGRKPCPTRNSRFPGKFGMRTWERCIPALTGRGYNRWREPRD
jgi:hypothetical protein